jgi:mono/diheme cytochrome c family protein
MSRRAGRHGRRTPGQHGRADRRADVARPRGPAGRFARWLGAALAASAVVLVVLVTVGNVVFHANINLWQRFGFSRKPAAGTTGAAIWAKSCAGCHGPAGQGGTLDIHGPAFAPGGPLAGLTFAQRVDRISHGRPLAGMPAWKFQLSAAEIRKVAAYTQLLSGQPPDPSVAPADVGTPGPRASSAASPAPAVDATPSRPEETR